MQISIMLSLAETANNVMGTEDLFKVDVIPSAK